VWVVRDFLSLAKILQCRERPLKLTKTSQEKRRVGKELLDVAVFVLMNEGTSAAKVSLECMVYLLITRATRDPSECAPWGVDVDGSTN
jgi:hypothetical protein